MNAMIQPIIESFRLSSFVVELQTGGLTDEQAQQRPNDGKGASIAWTLGHLCDYRVKLMNVFGAGKGSAYAEYATKSAAEIASYPSVEELRADWKTIAADLEGVLQEVTDEQLLAAAPAEAAVHGEKRMLDAMIFYPWHESYHLGGVGRIRTELGLTPTADLAMAASRGA